MRALVAGFLFAAIVAPVATAGNVAQVKPEVSTQVVSAQVSTVQRAKLADFAELPSARLLEEMRRQGQSFFEVGLWMSEMHRDYFRELYPPNPGRLDEFREEAAASLAEQQAVEARDALPFAEFVSCYSAGTLA